MLEVKFKKKHNNVKDPYLGSDGAACFDLYADSYEAVPGSAYYRYQTGISVEIPEGHVGLIFPRSSVCKTGAMLSNCVGVIDSDYRGEISAVFLSFNGRPPYEAGERCCQMMIIPIPAVKFIEVDQLSDTKRGAGGYGSTGK